MGAVVEGRYIIVLPVLVAVGEQVAAAGAEGADGLGEVAVRGRREEVEGGRVVVGEDPGKDGVLVEVVVGAAGDRVEVHEVLEVGELAPLPLLGHVGGAEELVGGGERGVARLRQAVARSDAHARQNVHHLLAKYVSS